ncbi:MAG: hypothetical protein GXP16_07160 [Gammaproteobacteria bacterium]|nr:hypothetical protein [Gammaproteobacteria bacterium]
MPCGFHINKEEGLVTITGNQLVPLYEAVSMGKALMADQNFEPTLPNLVDLRGLEISRSRDETLAFRRFILESYMPLINTSIAIVIDDSLDKSSLAGLYHLSCRMERTELFDHYEQALKWLMRREFQTGGNIQ